MIIIDTGAFIALFNPRDRFHAEARTAFANLSEPLITTYPVLSETCYLLARSVNHQAQYNFLKTYLRGAFQLFDLQPQQIEQMVGLMEKYDDLPMDLADASLVALADYLGHGRILTVDRRDFSVYRWGNNQPFENLLLS
jgi:uncharacterized protein